MSEAKYSLINDRLYVTFALQTLLSFAFAVFTELFTFIICVEVRGEVILLIRKRTVLKIMASAMGSVITVSAFKCADVGALDDISLQSPVSSLEIIEPYVPDSIPSVAAPSYDPSKSLRRDAVNLEANTMTVSSDDLDPSEEILDESAFTYDGSEVWVNVNLANVREEPDVEADVLDQLEYGSSAVRISYGTLWSKIRLEDGSEGYIMSSLLSEEEVVIATPTPTPTPEPTPTPVPTAAPTATPVPEQAPAETTVVQTEAAIEATAAATTAAPSYTESEYYATVYASCDINVRTGPGTSYPFVTLISRGDSIEVVAQTDNGWYKLSSGNYVKADLCCNEPLPEPTPVPAPDPAAAPVSAGDGSDFASYCCQFVGVRYDYGGASPDGFDRSGYVSYVYANYYGISLPHDAAAIAQCGTPVSMDNLQCGDVICHDYNNDGYIEHVSIYIGNGTYIHASDSRRGVVITNYCGGVATVRRFV